MMAARRSISKFKQAVFILQASDHSPENDAFTLMFLYVGVQLFGDPQQAQEILEVKIYLRLCFSASVCIILDVFSRYKHNLDFLYLGVIPLL